MDLQSLTAFITVAKTASFSKAADQLFVTQPAISKRVANLESELGLKLFDRIGRQVHLTEAGRTLLPRAQNILLELNDTRRALTQLSEYASGPLTIGTSHHIGLHRLPPYLRQYSKLCPEVDLDIHFMDSEKACSAVESGKIEIAVVTLPLFPSKQLEQQLIWPDPLGIVVHPEHELRQLNTVTLDALAAYPAILPDQATFTRRLINRAFASANVQLHTHLSTNYLETIKMLVSIGMGWSALPLSMVKKDIIHLPVPSLQLARQLGIVKHRERAVSKAGQILIDILEKQKPDVN